MSSDLNRFTDHSHPTPEEVGPEIHLESGEKVLPGQEGFLEALCHRVGATYEDLTSDASEELQPNDHDTDAGTDLLR